MSGSPYTVILGANGQVGREVTALAREQNRTFKAFDRATCDLTDRDAVATAIKGADFVVNCAAYTAVDKAESEPALAELVNATAVSHMALACKSENATLIHISTDYVFNGMGSAPWREGDHVDPQTVYGLTKAKGETFIRETLMRHVILRTAWVFGQHGANFVKTMRRLVASRNEISVVADQNGCPTPAKSIAEAIWCIRDQIAKGNEAFGTFHFAGAPETSWYGFAREILADRINVAVKPIPSTEYPTPAKRPLNSVLNCSKIHDVFGIVQPRWQDALSDVIKIADLELVRQR